MVIITPCYDLDMKYSQKAHVLKAWSLAGGSNQWGMILDNKGSDLISGLIHL
jgi:hypothetical protein